MRHDFLTAKVLDALPDDQREVWASERESLIAEYCWYPDWRVNPDPRKRAAAAPYVPMRDGQPFHNLPANPVEYNNWRLAEDGSLVR